MSDTDTNTPAVATSEDLHMASGYLLEDETPLRTRLADRTGRLASRLSVIEQDTALREAVAHVRNGVEHLDIDIIRFVDMERVLTALLSLCPTLRQDDQR